MRAKSPLTFFSFLVGITGSLLIIAGCSATSPNQAGLSNSAAFDAHNGVFNTENYMQDSHLSVSREQLLNSNTERYKVVRNFLISESVTKTEENENNTGPERLIGVAGMLGGLQDDDETTPTSPPAANDAPEPATPGGNEPAAAQQTSQDPYVVNSTNQADRSFEVEYNPEDHVVTGIVVASDFDENGYPTKTVTYALKNQIVANGLYVVSTDDLEGWDTLENQTVLLMRYKANDFVFVEDRAMEIELVHVPTSSLKAEGLMTVADGNITAETIEAINGAIAARALLQFGPIDFGNDDAGLPVSLRDGTTTNVSNVLGCSYEGGSVSDNCLFAGRSAYVKVSQEVWLERGDTELTEDFDEEKHLGYRASMHTALPKEGAENIDLSYSVEATEDEGQGAVSTRNAFRAPIYLVNDAIPVEDNIVDDANNSYMVRLVRRNIIDVNRNVTLDLGFEVLYTQDLSSVVAEAEARAAETAAAAEEAAEADPENTEAATTVAAAVAAEAATAFTEAVAVAAAAAEEKYVIGFALDRFVAAPEPPPAGVTPPVVDETAPVVVDETAPVVVDETAPVVVDETAPVVVDETAPVVVDETAPVVVDETAPVVVDETAPVVVDETAPVVVDETAPVVVDETAPVVVDETAPVVVDETAPVVVDETAPVVVDETAPVVVDETAPVVVDETAPVVDDTQPADNTCEDANEDGVCDDGNETPPPAGA